jgi:hypothetical protein
MKLKTDEWLDTRIFTDIIHLTEHASTHECACDNNRGIQ